MPPSLFPRFYYAVKAAASAVEGSQSTICQAAQTVTLQDLGSLGEFIGSIAVLASLLYLALQVRQATNWQRHAAALNRATTLTSPFFARSELPAVQAKIIAVDGFPPVHKALVERYDLTPEEAILWWRHLVLDALTPQTLAAAIREVLENPGYAKRARYHRERLRAESPPSVRVCELVTAFMSNLGAIEPG